MYCGHARLYVSAAACPHYCTDPDVTLGDGMGCPLVVHYWEDSQSVHGLRCYGNITRNISEYYMYSLYCICIVLITDGHATNFPEQHITACLASLNLHIFVNSTLAIHADTFVLAFSVFGHSGLLIRVQSTRK